MVVWAHEEGIAFGRGLAGSRIVAGDVKPADMDEVWNGIRRADAMRTHRRRSRSHHETRVGRRVRGTAISSCTSSRAARSSAPTIPIGVVEGIVAIDRYDVVIEGFANHAGTTPMAERQDALVAASQLVLAVREIATRPAGPAGRHRRSASMSSRMRPT